jgi:hypothetical protein
MANLKLQKLVTLRNLAGVLFISAALAPAMRAQVARQLRVDVGPNDQVSILASDVSYGEVLRALQRKLGWEIEIPSLADDLKVSYMRVETAQPQIALARLLEGSRLAYAFLSEANGARTVKVLVIPLAPREPRVTQDSSPSNPPMRDNAVASASPPLPEQREATTAIQPNAPASETAPDWPAAPLTMPLADAIQAIGVPPGGSPADVGKTMTLPISDAARIVGVPPGMSPGNVGKTTILPLPAGSGAHP